MPPPAICRLLLLLGLFLAGIEAQGIVPMFPIAPPITVWHCGTDYYPLSSGVSNKLFGMACRADSTKAMINQCCLSHDRCYCEHSLSRLACDESFCACLRSVTQGDNWFCRVVVMETTCFLASKFGTDPYGNCPALFLERIGLRPGMWK
ncbi:hypothetical protein L596_011504 [Steinernema carpocapsae]|uniref:Phospholipase A2 domain-containing protein n=1 Tax=Steinernema carpocapsae TaxID=34508 RepID=A0A4U5NU50_STECR|nr:hypothetical protein L596_011504 [Steinernema carpocapsae]